MGDKKDSKISDQEMGELQILGNFIAEALIRVARGSGKEEWEIVDEHDNLVGELAKCLTLQNLYLDREEYEKCALMKLRIRTISDKLGYDELEEDNDNEDEEL